jgi:acyl carrier protein
MEKKIIRIISEIKNDSSFVDRLNGTSNIIDEVNFDSLQMMKFILRIEDEFGVEIDFEEFDMENLNSIKDFSNFLSSIK